MEQTQLREVFEQADTTTEIKATTNPMVERLAKMEESRFHQKIIFQIPGGIIRGRGRGR